MTAADLHEKHLQSTSDNVRLAASGDTPAFTQLVKGNEGMLYRLSRATLRNDADAADAVQETIIAAWRRIGQLRNADRFPAWIARICVHQCYRIARGKKPRAEFEEPQATSQSDTKMDVMDAVLSLPEEMRPIVSLYYFEDWNIKEIARALGIFEGTVKSRLHRARGLLFDSLKGYKEEMHNGTR